MALANLKQETHYPRTTKAEVIAQHAAMLGRAVEQTNNPAILDGLRQDLQSLAAMADGCVSPIVRQYIENLAKSASQKFTAATEQEARNESQAAARAQQAPGAPPAPGLQAAMYDKLGAESKKWFDAIDPDATYILKPLVGTDGAVLEPPMECSGKRIRDAISRTAYHALPEKEKADIPAADRPPALDTPEGKKLYDEDMKIIQGLKNDRVLKTTKPLPGPDMPAPAVVPAPDAPSYRRVIMTPEKAEEVKKIATVTIMINAKVEHYVDHSKAVNSEVAAAKEKMPERNDTEKKMKAVMAPVREKEIVARSGLPEERAELAKTLREDVLEEKPMPKQDPKVASAKWAAQADELDWMLGDALAPPPVVVARSPSPAGGVKI